MLLKSRLREVAVDQSNALNDQKMRFIGRSNLEKLELSASHNLVISGIRRCGKSTLLKQLLKKYPGAYFNFEDPRIIDFELSDFQRLEEVLREDYEHDLFYFDEIQNIGEWERYIRSSHDKGLKFVLTGSNASLLSKELGTKLTGRYLLTELFPFSFAEFNDYRQQAASPAAFESYLHLGGFPEFLKEQNTEILQRLLVDIINRDIIVRHGIRQPKIINEIALYLLSNVGKKFSYNNISKQFSIKSTTTVISYSAFLEDAFIICTIPLYAHSIKKQLVNQKKVYAIDTGFIRANTLSFSQDLGRILENLVFLALRRKFTEIYYFEKKHECDFVVRYQGIVTLIVQVCYELNDFNLKREIAGLEEAREETKPLKSLILTMNQEDEINTIPILPVWKWLSSFESEAMPQ